MPLSLAPRQTVTFTIKSVPAHEAERKTLRRLMQMQPEVRKGLRRRAEMRRREDNRRTIRSGRIWIDRAKAAKLVRVEPGETFTLTLTPQIIPDVQSVEKYLSVKKG